MGLKLIVSDLDGTLLDSKQREISSVNADALKAAQDVGVKFVVATGRPYGNALEICRRAGLEAPYIISNHGAFVHTNDGQCIHEAGLDIAPLTRALDWLNVNAYYYSIGTAKCTYLPVSAIKRLSSEFDRVNNFVDAALNKEKLKERVAWLSAAKDAQLVENLDWIFREKVSVGHVTAVAIDAVKLQTGRDYFSAFQGMAMTMASVDNFEMVHPSVSKGNALEILARHLGISLEKVMAIGDNYNDISMLKRVGINVAVGNAEPAVKACCKYVVPTNDDNGVAHIVTQLLAG
ncbi:MAG: Cof-like hydrolase [Firmicutes bacterium]|nr:Cof-like hydrolase [Bacillota bacterium]